MVTIARPQRPGVSHRAGGFRRGGRPDITQTPTTTRIRAVETPARAIQKILNPSRKAPIGAFNETR